MRQARFWTLAIAAMVLGFGVTSPTTSVNAEVACGAGRSGSLEERIAACTAAIEAAAAKHVSNGLIRLLRGEAYALNGQLDLAMADFDWLIEREPDHVAARLRRASIYRLKRNTDAAIADYDKVIATDPKNVDAYDGRAALHFARRDFDGAVADYGRILVVHPENLKAYVGRSCAYRGMRDLDRALTDCAKAIEIAPKRDDGYICRGETQLYRNDLDRAAADFDRAIELNPRSASSFAGLAVVHHRRGNLEAAIHDLDQAIGFDSNNPGLYRSRGFLQLETERVKEAAEDFIKSLEPNPRDRYTQLWLDVARRRSAQPSRLAEAAKQFNLSDWPGPIIRFYLGEITAEDLLAKAEDSNPSKRAGQVCAANYFVGELALASKDDAGAAKHLAEAVRMCPDGFAGLPLARAELRSLGATP
ncbi:exported hypothetical protein [Bradyrhizobium sp. STM 3809]|nr:exported hypothetical protein [Bradyrhizobium sp. STM 3809]